jgi:hypothetical protein
MLISPVDSRRPEGTKGPLQETRGEKSGKFDRVLEASVEKGRTTEEVSEKVLMAAEILRLEMMRSAVSIGDGASQPAANAIGNTLKSYLTNNVGGSQKPDTKEIELPLQNEDEISRLNFLTPTTAESSPITSHSPVTFDPIIKKASIRYGIDEGLIKAVIKMESNFNPTAVSKAGARGLMQLMPGTASGLGVKDSFDPEQNIMAGTRFLRDMLDRYNGDLDSALAAYNWGPGNLEKSRGAYLPRETREYLVKVKKYYTQYLG